MSESQVGAIGVRLSRWLALQSLAGLACVSILVYLVTALGLESKQSEVLRQKELQVRHLIAETQAAIGLEPAALQHKLDDFLIDRAELTLRIERNDGNAFFVRRAPEFHAASRREFRFSVVAPTIDAAPLRVAMLLDTSSDERLLDLIGLTLLISTVVGAALISLGGYALVRLGLRPLGDLAAQIGRLTAEDLHRRIDGSAQPQELEPLILQFNELLARLNQAYEQLEGFNADVAHELGTPLSTLIASTELTLRRSRSVENLRDVLGSNLEELHRLAGIVRDMLFLSQSDRGSLARRQRVGSLAQLLRQVAELHDAALDEAKLGLVIEGDATGSFDVSLLQRAVSNLLANAERYGMPGTILRICIQVRDQWVRLTVVNRGSAIPSEGIKRLFRRFYRADRSRSGGDHHHGLGLAIVAAIARMHGGRTFAHCHDGETSIGMVILRGEASSGAGATLIDEPDVVLPHRSNLT